MRTFAALVFVALAIACGEDTVREPVRMHIDLDVPASASGPLRPDSPNSDDLWTYDPGDVVDTFDSIEGNFRIHFTRSGSHAVSELDVDASGVPDFVEEVASSYEEVLTAYEAMGFAAPMRDGLVPVDNGGDDKYDVYLLALPSNFTGRFRKEGCTASGVCTGFISQDNDFVGYGFTDTSHVIRLLASHEFFHFVQAGYNGDQNNVYGEGTAVWASEAFDSTMDDLEYFSRGYLSETKSALDVAAVGSLNPYSYGVGIFFRFLEEFLGDASAIVDLVKLTQRGSLGVAIPDWFNDVLPHVLAERLTDFPNVFREFAVWNLYTGSRADPSISYANGADYWEIVPDEAPLPFREDRIRMFYASTRYYAASPGSRETMTAALVAPPDATPSIEPLSLFIASIKDDAVADLVELDPTAGTTTVDVIGAPQAIVFVVNPLPSGESPRPSLCIGSLDEVAACRRAVLGIEEPAPDAGVGDGGAVGDDDDDDDDEPAVGCSCRASSIDASLFSFTLVLLLWRRRRGLE